MGKIQYKNAIFVKSAVGLADSPLFPSGKSYLPEVALLGRSNVGKSSLLNHLFHSKNLVKTSSTPGKTQTLNFFTVDSKVVFVDLPGYGYAAHSQTLKENWADSLQEYLLKRETLKLFLLLLDIRHLPSVEDRQMVRWLKEKNIACILVFTKVDKLTLSQRQERIKVILEELDCQTAAFVETSVLKNIGRNELIHLIEEAL